MTTGSTFQGKETTMYTRPLFRVFGRRKEIGRPVISTRLVEDVFIPGRIQARMRKEKGSKKWWSTQKQGLEWKILKVTIIEVKSCNRVNVERLNILVNFRVQHFSYPQNLKFLNTFLVFQIISIRFDRPKSGDFYITTKSLK